jgi:hypothetical protein
LAQRVSAKLSPLQPILTYPQLNRNDRRIHDALFPAIKTMAAWDWNWSAKLNRMQVEHLFPMRAFWARRDDFYRRVWQEVEADAGRQPALPFIEGGQDFCF